MAKDQTGELIGAFSAAPLERSRPAPPEISDQVRGAAIADTLDCLPYGVIIVNAQCRVFFMNDCAREIIVAPGGMSLADNRVVAATTTETVALRELIVAAHATIGHGANGTGMHDNGIGRDGIGRNGTNGIGGPAHASPCQGKSGRSGAITLSRPYPSRPLSVIVTALGNRGAVAAEPVAAIFIGDPENGEAAADEILKRLYGLTAAEARLTLNLLEGRGLAWAAEQNRMSLNTGRTHLKHVFEKTRTHRQAELVRLILRGPAMLRLG